MHKILLAAVVLSLGVSSITLAAKPIPGQTEQDKALTKKIVGKWQVRLEDKETKRKSIGWTVYASNGMASSRSITQTPDKKEIHVILEARWYILKGVLVTQVTKSSNVKIVKVGHTTREQLKLMSNTEMKYVDEDGKTVVEKRVASDPKK